MCPQKTLTKNRPHSNSKHLSTKNHNKKGKTKNSLTLKAEKLFAIGVAYQKSGDIHLAAAQYRKSILINPMIPDVYNNLGVILRSLGETEAAIVCYRKCLNLKPNNAGVYSNLGNAFRDLGNFNIAVKYFRKAISITPKNPETFFNYGLALRDLGELKQALDAFNKTLKLNPNHNDCKWDRALTYLTLGNYAKGFLQYESRLNLARNPQRKFLKPIWAGESLNGKTLLVFQEQGFGDMIQFARFIPLIKNLCSTVYLEVQPELYSLFLSIGGVDKLIKKGANIPKFDFCLPMMSLYKLLGISKKKICTKFPYLIANKNTKKKVVKVTEHKKHVGIAWAGKPSHKNDKNRSCSFKHFIQLLDLPHLSVQSLQKGPRESEISELGCESLLSKLPKSVNDFNDTAAIITQLDLVISVDTAIVHLAGALGKPTWVILPYSPDWRWMREIDTSPWYPSIQLFRQKTPNDWTSLMRNVKSELCKKFEITPIE